MWSDKLSAFFAEKSTHILNKKATQYNGINGPKALIESRRGCIVKTHLPMNMRGDGVEIFSTKDWRGPSAEVFHHLLSSIWPADGEKDGKALAAMIIESTTIPKSSVQVHKSCSVFKLFIRCDSILRDFNFLCQNTSRIQSLAFDFRRKKLPPCIAY